MGSYFSPFFFLGFFFLSPAGCGAVSAGCKAAWEPGELKVRNFEALALGFLEVEIWWWRV